MDKTSRTKQLLQILIAKRREKAIKHEQKAKQTKRKF